MIINLTPGIQNGEIKFKPANKLEEIYQNVRTILSTVRYSVPLDREFGVAADFVDAPTTEAKAEAEAEMFIALAKYEPRAKIISIGWEANLQGRMIANLTLEVDENELE